MALAGWNKIDGRCARRVQTQHQNWFGFERFRRDGRGPFGNEPVIPTLGLSTVLATSGPRFHSAILGTPKTDATRRTTTGQLVSRALFGRRTAAVRTPRLRQEMNAYGGLM